MKCKNLILLFLCLFSFVFAGCGDKKVNQSNVKSENQKEIQTENGELSMDMQNEESVGMTEEEKEQFEKKAQKEAFEKFVAEQRAMEEPSEGVLKLESRIDNVDEYIYGPIENRLRWSDITEDNTLDSCFYSINILDDTNSRTDLEKLFRSFGFENVEFTYVDLDKDENADKNKNPLISTVTYICYLDPADNDVVFDLQQQQSMIQDVLKEYSEDDDSPKKLELEKQAQAIKDECYNYHLKSNDKKISELDKSGGLCVTITTE